MFRLLARFLIRRAPWVLALLGVLTVGAAYVATGVRFDFTPQSIFTGNDDLLADAEQVQATFGRQDGSVLVLLRTTAPEEVDSEGARIGDATQDVLSPTALTWQARVAERLRTLEGVERVEGLATIEIPFFRITGGFGLDTHPLIRELPVSVEEADDVRDQLDDAPLIDGSLIGRDRRLAVVVAHLDPATLVDVDHVRREIAAIQAVLAELPPPPGYAVDVSGLPSIRVGIVDELQSDQASLFPIAGLLFVVMLTLVFRRMSGTVVPLLAAGAGLTWTIAIMVLAGSTFTLLSNVLPILLFVVGMSNAVHVVSRYAEESARTPRDPRGSAERAIGEIGPACLLTFTTTAIGFLSLMITRSAQMQEFGWQAGLGMACLFVSVLTFSATLLPGLRPPRSTGHGTRPAGWFTRGLARVDRLVRRYPAAILAVSGLCIVAALVGASRMQVNAAVLETFDPGHPSIRVLKNVEERLGGVLPIDVELRAADPATFLDPAVYARVASLEAFAAGEPAVTSVRSYVDLYQELHVGRRRSASRDDMPTNDAEGGERLEKTAELATRLGDAVQLERYLGDRGRATLVAIRLREVGTRKTIEIVERLESRLAELFPPGSPVTYTVTGDAVVNALGLDRLVRDVYWSLMGATVLVFLVIGLLFRSTRVALIAIPANTFPLAATLGWMALRGMDLNAGNVIVFCVGLGLAVDNTIHFVARFREELATIPADRRVRIDRALRRTIRGTGRAIVLTSLFLVTGLSVLPFSDFVPTARFGELTIVLMFAALAADLLVLPACLKLFWPRQPAVPAEERVTPSTAVPASAPLPTSAPPRTPVKGASPLG